jgi:anti-sigma B factor antagonist
MTTPLSLTTTQRPDGATVLAAVGEIDMSNADTFTRAMDDAGTGPLVVDLTAVKYLDSAGLAGLFAHAEHIRVVANQVLTPVLTVSGLSLLTVVDGT